MREAAPRKGGRKGKGEREEEGGKREKGGREEGGRESKERGRCWQFVTSCENKSRHITALTKSD